MPNITSTDSTYRDPARVPRVPFADLFAQYSSIKSDIDAAISEVIAESAFVRGRYVEEFEKRYAEEFGVKHCVSCANGTDALYIAMCALGVKPGDEVIVPAISWISTSETVTQAGATVVFCDIDPVTYTLDSTKLEGRITPRTVGIIPVHLYGQPADMGAIMKIAHHNNLWVVEDCAQAHLATIDGQLVGTFGVAATFSFYPGKNLGAMGDAGAIVTSDGSLANHMAMFARHGGLRKGDHQIEGINSRLDGLQAAVLSVKLKHLRCWTERRQTIAARYNDALGGLPNLDLPQVAAGRVAVWHLYVVAHADRDGLAEFLNRRGIQTVVNYPCALPFLPCYRRLGHETADFPVAHRLQSRVLSLPIYPEMSEEQFKHVTASVIEFVQGCSN